MLSAKNKVVVTIFGVLAVVIFLMYVLDRTSNKRVERFKDTEEEDDDNVDDVEEENEEEQEEVPKTKPSKKTVEKLPVANANTMKETSIPKGHDEHPDNEDHLITPNDEDDVVSNVSKWVSSLNIPSSLKTETFKEMFSEENVDKMKSMVNFQQAKDWVNGIMSSINTKKEAFASTISQRRTINELKDKLRQMEEDLTNLMDDLDDVAKDTKTKPITKQTENTRQYVTFGPAPAPSASIVERRARNDTAISINSLPSVAQDIKPIATSASRLTDKEPIFAKNSDTVSSSLGKKITARTGNVIEGFENVRHNFAMY